MKTQKATFAGGCFWCIEAAFKEAMGVIEVISGYTGGNKKKNPTYNEVCSGKTGHYEAVQITYDPSKISYEGLLDIFWRQIDPTDAGGQFADRGEQYMTAIFYHDSEQKKLAEDSKNVLEKSGRFDKPIATKLIKFKEFFRAENHHQNYSKKCPIRYNLYKKGSGREKTLGRIWDEK